MWYLRPQREIYTIDPKDDYDGQPTKCTIKLIHGGQFTKFPEVKYIDGKVNYVDMVDTETFSILDLHTIMKVLGYRPGIFYHFLVPGGDFQFGLRPLGNDDDLTNFARYVRDHKIMRVFTEHGKTNLFTYNLNPSPVRKVTLVQLDEIEEVGEGNVEVAPQPVVVAPQFPALPAPPDDSDYWVDEDNIIDDVEVDMRDFNLNIDTDAEFLGARLRKSKEKVVAEEPDELDVIDNDAFDSLEDDSDQDRKRRAIVKQLGKEKTCSLGEVHTWQFHLGQKYQSKEDLKEKIKLHSLETRRNITFVKNDKKRLRAICKGIVAFNEPEVDAPTTDERTGGPVPQKSKSKKTNEKKSNENGKKKDVPTCPWVLHASRSTVEDNWYIKTYDEVHTCLNSRRIKVATAKFLSNQIVEQLESNPKVPVKALQEQLMKKYQVGFSKHKIFRAKSKAKRVLVGDTSKQYEHLRDYALELQSTNPDTTVKVEVVSEGNISMITRQFKRIYVCLGGMKKGFKAGLRDFVGLDGTHLKGAYTGQILTAVGVDSNNGIYPLAYAIVDAENFKNWKWFLTCLGDDLDLNSMSNFTFVSDRQKGLLNAVEQLFPCAEHRFCLRHIHQNMRRTWSTKEYKDHLWKCATASTVQEFNHYMKELRDYDVTCFEWLNKIPAQHWARSHFSGRATTDMLLNNICEVFNAKLVDGRDKPVIGCLEFIREYMMKRICNVIKVQQKCLGPLTPAATKVMEKIEAAATEYIVHWNGDEKYQVQGPWQDQHVVDMGQRECSCRKWELTGFPCKHVIAVLHNKADNGETVGMLHTYVHRVHWLETWKAAYVHKVEPIKGRSMWPVSDCPIKITPPPHHTQPGRPKRKRRQSMDERIARENEQRQSQTQSQSQGQGSQAGPSQIPGHGPRGTGKLTRRYIKVTCGKCGSKGHNKRTCTAP